MANSCRCRASAWWSRTTTRRSTGREAAALHRHPGPRAVTTTPSGTSAAAASSPATPSACLLPRVRRRRPALDAADDDAGGLRARAAEGFGAAHARLRAECMYLTHFGRVADVERLGADLLEQIDAMVRIGRACPPGPQRHAALRRGIAALYLERLQVAHGCGMPAAQSARTARDGRRAQCAGPRDLARPGPLDWLDKGWRWARHASISRTRVAVVTGAAQGIGRPAPSGWRPTARRWRCGTWTTPVARRSPRRWRTRRARALPPLRRVAKGRRRRRARSNARRLRPRRRARQQRRHLQGGRLPRHHRGRLGCGDRRQPQGSFPSPRPWRGRWPGRAAARS